MKEWLVWLSWILFLVSAGAVIAGGLIGLKTGKDIGVYITYAGFIGLAISGLLMAGCMERCNNEPRRNEL